MSNRTPASRGRRISATLIDALLTAVFVAFLTLASGQFEVAGPYLEGTVLVRAAALVAAGYLLLHAFLLHRYSQTIGKKLLGLQIVHAEQPAPFWRLMVRAGALLALIFVPVIGFLLQWLHLVDIVLFFLPKSAALHDRISGTRVVDLNEKTETHG